MTDERNLSYEFGPFRLSGDERLLFRGDKPVPLPPKALDLLLALVEAAGRVVNKQVLLETIWPEAHVEEANLSQTVYVLRKALAENGNGPEYIETIPKRGYRFKGQVRLIEAEASVAGGRGRNKSRPYAVALAVVLILLAAYLVGTRLRPARPAGSETIRLAVIPFINLSTGDQDEFLADGITEEMITELAQMNPERLEVIARTTAMQYKGTKKATNQIAGDLDADYLLTGRVRRDGNRLRVTAQLVRAREQVNLWAGTYERELRDMIGLQTEIARTIAGQIQLTLSPAAEARLAQKRPVHPEAFEAYLRGRYLWNRRTPESERSAREYFERAIELEPEYAEAYASLAESYAPRVRRDFRGEPLARKALQLHPDLPEAHAALGAIYHYLFDWTAHLADCAGRSNLIPTTAPHGCGTRRICWLSAVSTKP